MNAVEGGGEARRRPPLDDASRTEVARLASEVYGEDADSFMSTPRASLGMRSPADAIADGDLDLYAKSCSDHCTAIGSDWTECLPGAAAGAHIDCALLRP